MTRKASFAAPPASSNGPSTNEPPPKPEVIHIGFDPMRLGFIKFRPEWVIDPEGTNYYRWLFVVFLAVFYNAVMIVPRAVFKELTEGPYFTYFTIADYISDIIYIADLFVRACVGYLAEERIMVREPRKLIYKWLHSWKGKLDIISIIPTDFALIATGMRTPYPIIRINRILKWGRLEEFARRSEGRVKAADIFRLSVILIKFIWLIHLNACLYYFLSERMGLNSDDWVYPSLVDWKTHTAGETNANDTLVQKYTWSFYWSLHTLTMIGIVPQPQTEWQFLFMTIEYIISVMLFSQILGNVSRTIINLNVHENEFRTRMDTVKNYMKQRNIGSELQQRVMNYFEYQWTNQQIIDEKEALAILPDKLESEIAIKVHMETLKRVRIFQGVESGLLADLVLKLKLQVFSPGDYVCRKGDIGKEMYIVKRGRLEVVSDAGDVVFATIGEGSVFGEISILNIAGIKSGNRRTANVRSVGYSDLFCLSKEDLWDALKEYPEGKNKMLELGKQLLIKDNLLDLEAAELEERRHNEFLDKVERVEVGVDNLQTRLGRLVAERSSTVQKLERRIAALDHLLAARTPKA